MIIAFLKRIRFLDADGTLSSSHITLFLSLILFPVRPGRESIAFFLLALLNFNAGKWFSYLKTKKDLGDIDKLAGMQKQIDQLTAECGRLNAALSFKVTR